MNKAVPPKIPVASPPPAIQQPQHIYVTTQATSKWIKTGLALSFLGAIFSLVIGFAYPLALFVTGACVFVFLVFRILRWFNHG